MEGAISKSHEEGDGDPVFHDVDANVVNPFADKSTQSDVYASLAKKGLVECSGIEDLRGGEMLEDVCITPEGLEALKVARSVN